MGNYKTGISEYISSARKKSVMNNKAIQNILNKAAKLDITVQKIVRRKKYNW